nr:MAG TPA: Putative transcriptional regulator [Caudoviricetes sp.]
MTQSIGLDEGKGHHHPVTVSVQVSGWRIDAMFI